MPRVALGPAWMWWRPRAVRADDDALVIERRRGDERIAWDAIDAVIDTAPVRIEAGGRVLARLPADDEAVDALVEAIVLRAGLEWVEARRRRLPRMAVRPAVAARLRSGQTAPASADLSAPGDSHVRGDP